MASLTEFPVRSITQLSGIGSPRTIFCSILPPATVVMVMSSMNGGPFRRGAPKEIGSGQRRRSALPLGVMKRPPPLSQTSPIIPCSAIRGV